VKIKLDNYDSEQGERKDKYMSPVNDIIKQEIRRCRGSDIHLLHPLPRDVVQASARFSESADTKSILQIGHNICSWLTIHDNENIFVVALGETQRYGNTDLPCAGVHMTNAHRAHNSIHRWIALTDMCGSSRSQDYSAVVTGIVEVDKLLKKIIDFRCEYKKRFGSDDLLQTCLSASLDKTRKLLNGARRTADNTARRYSIKLDNANNAHTDVCDSLRLLYDKCEEWTGSIRLENWPHVLDGDVHESILSIKVLLDMVLSLGQWTIYSKRFVNGDLEESMPEGTAKSMSETFAELRSHNDNQIRGIESVNNFLGGFSLPIIGLAFTVLAYFPYLGQCLIFIILGVAFNFIATGFTFRAWFYSSRHKGQCPSDSELIKAKESMKKGAFMPSNNKEQWWYLGEERSFFDLTYGLADHGERIPWSRMVADSIRAVTQSSWDLHRLRSFSKTVHTLYLTTVVLYAAAAFHYGVIWIQRFVC